MKTLNENVGRQSALAKPAKNAAELSEKATIASHLASLWLEHPWVAHDLHELAASAQEQVPNQRLAAEHRIAAQYWAQKACDWERTRYHTTN